MLGGSVARNVLFTCLSNSHRLRLSLRCPGKLVSELTRENILIKLSTSCRGFHGSAAGSQNKKLSVLEKRDEDVSENDKASSEVSHSKPDSPAVHTVRGPPPSELEPQEYRLPYHDEKRVTSEHRKFEVKSEIMFDDLAIERGATKQTFLLAVNKYLTRETLYRRGAVEFVYAGMRELARFGVERDVTAYKALLKVFPQGKMIPRNAWQVEFMHYPRQQQCVIDMLEQMEHKGVIPDRDFGRLLKDRFGSEAHVTRKYRRIRYWLPKFKNMNPYPIPYQLPTDALQLALLALKRMTVDGQTRFTVWRGEDFDASRQEQEGPGGFIASAQSPSQQALLARHPAEAPLFVEGPFPVFLKYVRQHYFLLRAEPNTAGLSKQKEWQKKEDDEDNLFEWTNFFDDEQYSQLQPALSVHEQEDGTVLALAIASSTSKHSAVQWVRSLEKDNPQLAKVPVLFHLLSNDTEVQTVEDVAGQKFKDRSES